MYNGGGIPIQKAGVLLLVFTVYIPSTWFKHRALLHLKHGMFSWSEAILQTSQNPVMPIISNSRLLGSDFISFILDLTKKFMVTACHFQLCNKNGAKQSR